MNADTKFLELPLKYAFIATLIFAGSAFLLGYFYQFLALSAMDMSSTGASWAEIKDIPQLSFDRALRYFIFYFLIFLSLTAYMRSSAKSSPWGPIILLAIIPSVAGIIPFLLSTGEFRSHPFWSFLAILIALMFLGINPKSGTKSQRMFFIGLLIVIVAFSLLNDVATWGNESYKMAIKIYGEGIANSKTSVSFFYFAPAAIISVAVNIYLIFKIPSNFLNELNKPEL